MKVVAFGVIGGCMGVLLASMGFPFNTLEWWAVIGLMVCYGWVMAA